MWWSRVSRFCKTGLWVGSYRWSMTGTENDTTQTNSTDNRTASTSSTAGFPNEATSRFTVASWSETAFVDIDGEGTTMGDTYYPKRGLTQADVAYRYTGGMEGTGTVRYLIGYQSGEAPVLGFERFEGSIAGQEGSCVFRHLGVQDAGSVTATIEVVEGLGTGGLAGLRGRAELRIAGESKDGYELVLDYALG